MPCAHLLGHAKLADIKLLAQAFPEVLLLAVVELDTYTLHSSVVA